MVLNRLLYLNNFWADSIGLFSLQSAHRAEMRSRALFPCVKWFRVVLLTFGGFRFSLAELIHTAMSIPL